MPLESEYSDDFDFMDISKDELKNLLPVMKQASHVWNLQINESVEFRLTEKLIRSSFRTMEQPSEDLIYGVPVNPLVH